MPESENPKPARWRLRLWRWAAILACLGLVFFLALAGFVVHNMTRPVSAPAVLMSDAEWAAEIAPTTSATRTHAREAAPAPAAADHATTRPAAAPPMQFIPEDSQPTAALRDKARAINKNYRAACEKLAALEAEASHRTDPDTLTAREKEMLADLLYFQFKVGIDAEKDFGLEWRRRFDRRSLGLYEEYQDWYGAAAYCAIQCGDWDWTVYYCRKMGKAEGMLMIGVMGGTRLAVKASDFLDQFKKKKP